MAKSDTDKLIARLKEEIARGNTKGISAQGLEELLSLQLECVSKVEHVQTLRQMATIRAVAILQSSLKESVAALVDNWAKNNHPLPKIDSLVTLDLLKDLHGGHFTIGQFYAATCSFSGLETIGATYKNLTGQSIDKLLTAYKTLMQAVEKPQDFDAATKRTHLARLFIRRNIICHEAAKVPKIEASEILEELHAVWVLIGGALYSVALHPVPKQQKGSAGES